MLMINDGDGNAPMRAVVAVKPQAGLYRVRIDGEASSGNAGVLYVVNEYNHVLGETPLRAEALFELPAAEEYALLVEVPPHSSARIESAELCAEEADDAIRSFCDKRLRGSVAVVAPTYPSPENMYLCAFVHARVLAYRDAQLRVDVLCAFDYRGWCIYEFEGVRVLRMSADDLARVLQWRKYRAVLLHFFDLRYAREWEKAGLDGTPLFLWSHNPETRYWDWPLFTTPYFSEAPALTPEQVEEFRQRDEVIKRFNAMPNVSWVFVSEALRKRSEELLGFSFNRAHVIPNLVDEKLFPYRVKDAELRKKIFLTRKFENVNTYALDIVAAVIAELSERPFFADLEFDVYGTGSFYDELTAPLRPFRNVHLHRRFLSRDEIAEACAEHGIALYPTRFDSQGVSMGEAALSGLAVVSSDIDAARCFLPTDQGLLCEVENPVAYADAIERLYRDPVAFAEASQACHDKVSRMCGRAETVAREIELVKRSMGGGVRRGIGRAVSSVRALLGF